MGSASLRDRLDTVRSLQQRIRTLEKPHLDGAAVPTDAAFVPLLGGHGLQRGGVYRVSGSLQLSLLLAAQASRDGAWCAILGMPQLGVDAVQDTGISLERTVWVPSPGARELTVLSSLIEVCGVVLTEPLRVSAQQCDQLGARLREHGSVLITTGEWGSAAAELHVEASRWLGLERGFGMLHTRELTVSGRSRLGTRRAVLRLRGSRVEHCPAPHTARVTTLRAVSP